MSVLPLYLDIETRSAADLNKFGVHRYAEESSTEVLCVCYTVGDEPIKTWRPGEPVPEEIGLQVIFEDELIAHNKDFERTIWSAILTPRFGWPSPSLRQWSCTAAHAQMLSLPRSLDDAATVIGSSMQKDEEGHRLMLRMSKPRDIHAPGSSLYSELSKLPPDDPSVSRLPDGRIIRWHHSPEKLDRLVQYCVQDVATERAIHKFMMSVLPMPTSERLILIRDAEINDRGLRADLSTIDNAARVVEEAQHKLRQEMLEITGGRCTPTQIEALTTWLATEHGVQTGSLDKASVAALLARNDLSAPARRVLEIRRGAAAAGVKKLQSMRERAGRDGRIRGNFLYHGAHTGRWSGKGVQFQNLMRPSGKIDVPSALQALERGDDAEIIDLLIGPPIDVVGECMRGMIVADAGKDFIAADFANIEGRVNAWLAGEQWKIDAFRAYDEGTGPDLYLVSASRIYHRPIETLSKISPERQVGKVAELAMGYQGGTGAFQSMAKNYGLTVKDQEAESIKVAWRVAHPAMVQSWRDMQDAAFNAVNHPDTPYWCCDRKLAFARHGAFLWMRLPSGRYLAYPSPHIREETRQIAKIDPITGERTEETITRASVCYWAVDGVTKKWARHVSYGGRWCENAVQAISRDLLAEAMLRAEATGYPIVLHAHDELVAEVPESFGSIKEFTAILEAKPQWALDCPIAAAGWRDRRYRK